MNQQQQRQIDAERIDIEEDTWIDVENSLLPFRLKYTQPIPFPWMFALLDLNDPVASKMGIQIWERKACRRGRNLGLELSIVGQVLKLDPAILLAAVEKIAAAGLIRIEKTIGMFVEVTIRVNTEWGEEYDRDWLDGNEMLREFERGEVA